MYFTNYRAIPGKYFEDALYYPLVRPVATLTFSSDSSLSFQSETGPASNSFISVVNPRLVDTLFTIFTNSDVQDAIAKPGSFYPFSVNIFSSPEAGSSNIANKYSFNFSAPNSGFWADGEVLNNQVVQSAQSLAGPINYVFPSPFNYAKNAYMYIPVNQVSNGNVQFNVYNIAMKLVFSSNQVLNYYNGKVVIKWDGRNSSNNKLPTGVYIYAVKSGDSLAKGKLVIFNQ
jgi:hypothetical protein